MIRNVFTAAVLCVVVATSANSAAAVEITVCGQEVPAYETGTLASDLDCSAFPDSSAVVLQTGAVLDLQGHTLTGSSSLQAVLCLTGEARCRENACTTICRYGPVPCTVTSTMGTGVIIAGYGILSQRSVIASNLDIRPLSVGISLGSGGRLEATDVVLENGDIAGIDIHSANCNCFRCFGPKLTLTNVRANGFGDVGIYAYEGSIQGTGITTNDNGRSGINAKNVDIVGLEATGNGALSDGESCSGGICGGKIKLLQATITGNTNFGFPMDIASTDLVYGGRNPSKWKRPKVDNTVCGASGIYVAGEMPPYETWGICTND